MGTFIVFAIVAAIVLACAGAALHEGEPFGALCCALFGALLICAMWGVGVGEAKARAVDAGHAEFYLDAEHNKEWRWLAPCAPGHMGGCAYTVPAEEAK